MNAEDSSGQPFSWLQRYPKLWLTIVSLIFLLPFADKAFHIDDPLFVWAGQQMQSRWWDPFGFQVNWYGWAMPMHEVTKNPPLACAFLAILISLFGLNEFFLHAGFILQAVAAILGTYALAQRVCQNPVHVGLLTLFTPAFLVSSTTLMCDVLMAAFWVWSVAVWLEGLEKNNQLKLILAAFLMSGAALAKYFGIALIPLLLVFTIVKTRRLTWSLLYLLIPIVVMFLYEGAMRASYGHGMLLDAFRYAGENEPRKVIAYFQKALIALAFAGGCCGTAFFLRRAVFRHGSRLILIVLGVVLLPATWSLSSSWSTGTVTHAGIAILWAFLAVSGIFALLLPVLEWNRARSVNAILFLFWIWGTFLFCILNWTINARSVLPMVPAVAILLIRRIESQSAIGLRRIHWPLAMGATLSLVICLADYRLANSARTAVAEIEDRFDESPPSRIWFQGHWGFQFYAQTAGWRPYDLNNPVIRDGDMIILPFNNTNLKQLSQATTERIATIQIATFPFIATMSRSVGAGFYMDFLGPLPFSFGSVPPEKYYVIKVKEPSSN